MAVGSHDGEAERAVRRMRGDGALIANDDWHGDDEGFRAFLASAFKAAMELDPRYCDVILERWERLTGRTAVRED